MSYSSFEDLDVWKLACKLSVDIYKVTFCFKDYSLRDQINRASISIASNIAEGAERGSNKDYIRFLHIAKGSAAELRTQVYISTRLNLIDQNISSDLVGKLVVISRKLHSLIKSLSHKS